MTYLTKPRAGGGTARARELSPIIARRNRQWAERLLDRALSNYRQSLAQASDQTPRGSPEKSA